MPSTAPVARESFQFQVQEDQVANVLVVFDDKDPRPGGCTSGRVSGEHTSSVSGPRSPPGSLGHCHDFFTNRGRITTGTTKLTRNTKTTKNTKNQLTDFSSLTPQYLDRVHPGSPAGRDVACDGRDGDEQQGDLAKRASVVWRQAIKELL